MALGLSSLVVATTLALHPFGSTMIGGRTQPAPDPSWNEPEDPETTETAEAEAEPEVAPGPDAEPAGAPLPVIAPAPLVVTRPVPSKGTGLIIASSIVGGLAWLTAIGRMTTVRRCTDAIATGEIVASAGQCIFKTGTALLLLTPAGWITNGTTYGLAPAAGMVRGKYDGVAAAWDGAPERTPGAFIGSGAALLGLGVIGRIITFNTFGRSLEKCVGGVDACRTALTMHFLGAQVSSSSIATGAGLLAYGIAYSKHRKGEDERRKAAGLAQLRLSPQLGWSYTGLSLSGRF